MEKSFIVSIVLGLTSLIAMAQNNYPIIAPGASIELLADGFRFTEGPAADKHGNVYFTDQPNDKIHIWSTDGKLTTFLSETGRANGLYFDHNGNLLSCSDMNNELWSIDMQGNAAVIAAGFDEKKLNGPNDLWVHPNGGIYLTDPLYKGHTGRAIRKCNRMANMCTTSLPTGKPWPGSMTSW